jgi:hypothetical protein
MMCPVCGSLGRFPSEIQAEEFEVSTELVIPDHFQIVNNSNNNNNNNNNNINDSDNDNDNDSNDNLKLNFNISVFSNVRISREYHQLFFQRCFFHMCFHIS